MEIVVVSVYRGYVLVVAVKGHKLHGSYVSLMYCTHVCMHTYTHIHTRNMHIRTHTHILAYIYHPYTSHTHTYTRADLG